MELTRTPPQQTWLDALREHARQHALAAVGLGVGAWTVLALLVQSLVQLIAGEANAAVRYIPPAAGRASAPRSP